MGYRAIFCSFLCAFATASAAQQPSAHIDLNVMAGQPSPNEAAFGIAFIDSPPVCPEGNGALQISDGTISLLVSRALSGTTSGTAARVVDDETQQIRLTTFDCLIEVVLRAQVFRDGQWISLLVPESMRPSVSREERTPSPELRLAQQRLAAVIAERAECTRARLRNELPNDACKRLAALSSWLQGPSTGARMDRISKQTGGALHFLRFDGMPENCVKAAGEYSLDQKGIMFFFPTNFPDDYNRFAAQLYRFDDFRSQLVFLHGDCRIEMTVGKAIRNNGNWLPIPIASIARSR